MKTDYCAVMPTEKQSLRKLLQQMRKELSVADAEMKSRSAQETLLSNKLWGRAATVALYAAKHPELSSRLLLECAWKEGKTVLLPRIINAEAKIMEFAVCKGWEDLARGPFNILEPLESRQKPEQLPWPDIIVIPGLAFDVAGNRLGYGGGYYDRFLGNEGHKMGKAAIKIGLCFAFQILQYVPHDNKDQKMDALCSEKGIIWM